MGNFLITAKDPAIRHWPTGILSGVFGKHLPDSIPDNLPPPKIYYFRPSKVSSALASLKKQVLQIHQNNRNSVFSVLRAGLVNYSVPLELTKYLINEIDYLPWHRVISAVTYIADMLEDDTNLYLRFQVMKQKYIPAWGQWIWQLRICNGNNIEVQLIFSVAELSVISFCYCTLKQMLRTS